MALNIANIDKLLAFMRALPPEHFSMEEAVNPSCSTPGCVMGCIWTVKDSGPAVSLNSREWIGISDDQDMELFQPFGYGEANTTGDFPLARAIDVVQHLRETGEVDWARFPAGRYRAAPAASKPAWTPPVVIAIEPELPESLTSLLRQPVEVSHG